MTVILGQAPVAVVPFTPTESRQSIQSLAVSGASASDKSGAGGTYADRGAQDSAGLFRGRSVRADNRSPGQATGESVVSARVRQEGTPQERLVAAQSELSAKQQAKLRAVTTAELAIAERQITNLREMIVGLENELRALVPTDHAVEPGAAKSESQQDQR